MRAREQQSEMRIKTDCLYIGSIQAFYLGRYLRYDPDADSDGDVSEVLLQMQGSGMDRSSAHYFEIWDRIWKCRMEISVMLLPMPITGLDRSRLSALYLGSHLVAPDEEYDGDVSEVLLRRWCFLVGDAAPKAVDWVGSVHFIWDRICTFRMGIPIEMFWRCCYQC